MASKAVGIHLDPGARRGHADYWQVTQDALERARACEALADPQLRQRLLDLYFALPAFPEVLDAPLDRLHGRPAHDLSDLGALPGPVAGLDDGESPIR